MTVFGGGKEGEKARPERNQKMEKKLAAWLRTEELDWGGLPELTRKVEEGGNTLQGRKGGGR